METIGKIIKNRKLPVISDSNDIKDNTVINGNKSKYALNREKFTPHTPETMLAEEIAIELHDLNNFACYLYVVNKIGVMNAKRLLESTKDDIKEKKKTKYPVRSGPKYFMNKYRHKRY